MNPEFWISLLSSALVSGALASAIVFLAKNLISERLKNSIQHEYNEKLESFRSVLNAKSEAELARLKADLEIAATEHRVRFSKLHEQSADAILGTYDRLKMFEFALDEYTNPLESRPKAAIRAELADYYDKLWRFFAPKKILFPRATADRIDGLMGTMSNIARRFAMQVEGKGVENVEKWKELREAYLSEARPILSDLENHLREQLGYKSS